MTGSNATYFGKTPRHADFVRGRGHEKLISLLDDWITRAMQALSQRPDWKSTYDGTSALHFAFVSPTSMLSLIGTLSPSRDASGRRFPFLTASTIPRHDLRLFRCAPSALANSYGALSTLSDSAVAGMELDQLENELNRLDCARDFDLAIAGDPLGHFVRETRLEALAASLGGRNTNEAVARTLLAIGLLMQQLFAASSSPVDKTLALPLPPDNHAQYWQVAGLWLYLITGFVRKPAMELQIIFERNTAAARMLVGFNGATAHPLCTALRGPQPDERTLCLIDPPWIDKHPALLRDNGLRKLASYLAQPTLSLERILITFRDAFLKT